MNPIDEYKQSNDDIEPQVNRQHKIEDLKNDEKEAIEYVKGIKEFYSHLLFYVLFGIVVFVFKNRTSIEFFWPYMGWSVGVIAHGLMAFEVINLKMHKWEKRQIEKKLGRKL